VHHSNWKYGQTREDGYVFVGWKRRNEKVTPDFRNPILFKKLNEASKIRKQIKNRKIKEIENKIKTEKGCSHCGEHFYDNPEVLDWHHTDPSKKKCDVSSIRGNSWKQLEVKKREWEKCIVLCSNCHRTETRRIRLAQN
jgi:hypothetical protein